MNDDSNFSLRNIVTNHGKSIASLLLNIGENKQPQRKYLSFIQELECLRLENSSDGPILIRREINAFEEQDYVALSYTWGNSEQESPVKGKYKFQTRGYNPQFFPSPVRDSVFDRVFSFMRAKGLSMLWIDRHCVKQKTCKTNVTCAHKRCEDKKRAIETMDLVYSLSKHPVALLGKPIEWEHELDVLFKILSGQFVKELEQTDDDEILQALSLLSRITKDRWWTRAWTFQEDYRGRRNMTLLIRHPDFLEAKKREYEIFSDVPNELCIQSIRFSEKITEFCRAVQDKTPQREDVSHHTKYILGAAGNYKILLESSMPMTPRVIADIQRRGLDDAWDKLAIIANCCQYNIRIDHKQMQKPNSLSISILAMYLLNREILLNDSQKDSSLMIDKTLSQFLEDQAFKEFYAPEGERDLTFNKGCRFIDTEFAPKGIKTEGHLWKLGRIIDPATFLLPLPEAKNKAHSVNQDEQRCLAHLAAELRRLHETTLAMHIKRFLSYDPTRQEDNLKNETFSRSYMRLMAKELVKAIKEGKLLRLGRIWNFQKKPNPCSAIFIWNADGAEETTIKRNPSNINNKRGRKPEWKFAFTASRPLKRGFQQHGTNDLDHHVSLEVKWPSSRNHSPSEFPQLFVRSWIVGLCFFYDFPRTSVIFSWPSSFNTVIH
ncbi:heterokaryon incompatibility protein [Fusarium mundagurra]|uniref:Heterokaryon incompatibility protein n=1 Tax=Fusarium mundagurra TaxID=1567541 RepID=A0A8H5XPB9_9HYPO|nr:heterokaryon incompatibility protein [Fusarium mundagurra]